MRKAFILKLIELRVRRTVSLSTFQDDNNTNNKKAARKKSKLYSNTKVKARSFLTNISYRRYKEGDFKKDNFVVDVFLFLVQNLNLTMLDQKFDSDIERDYVKMLWENCVPVQLCKFVYLKFYTVVLAANHIAKS